MLPGYLIARSGVPAVCVPFTTTAEHPPASYAGRDFYVDEFSDTKLRERWAVCKTDASCLARVGKPVHDRVPPNREYRLSDEHARFLLGKLDEGTDVDLAWVRRPAFFAKAPYREGIAELESRTWTVEFTAPAEAHERLQRHITDNVKLRGWYVQGDGVDDGQGHRVRALIVMSAGGGGRLVAIDDPIDQLYRTDSKTGKTTLNNFPNATTGSPGQREWREQIRVLQKAGFDVLSYDRRGVGISTGFSDTNTLQQGRDLLNVIASLSSGEGMRALSPNGVASTGAPAARALSADVSRATMPVLLLGSSRGTMAAGWAMALNFDKTCDYDLPVVTCGPPVDNRNIKGIILISEFTAGPGFVPAESTPEDDARGLGRDRGMFIAGSEVEHNVVFFPGSAILASASKWPAAFYARGLWDYAASLQGTIDSYDRVKGLKELVVVRGPHPFETWPDEEKERVTARMVAFAKAAALGRSTLLGGRPWTTMKDLVGTASDVWEPSSRPSGR